MGTGKRPVTSAQVLRKADVPTAGAAIGVRVPPNTRTAADVPELHGPWSAAIAMGLLRISDRMVTSGHALEGWPPSDAVLLDAWFAGLRAVCEALADPRQEDGFTGMLVFALTLRRTYSDPSFTLEDAADEDGIRVRDACRPGVKVGYEYDFGASWQHEITAQKAFMLDPDQSHPVCVAYQGDSPVEYPSEENPQEPEPFSLTEVNRKLAKLG
jgi:hypothetical protein